MKGKGKRTGLAHTGTKKNAESVDGQNKFADRGPSERESEPEQPVEISRIEESMEATTKAGIIRSKQPGG